MDVKNLLIFNNKTLIEALDQLNQILYIDNISKLILFVVNENNQVIGSITDGDIRRALVKFKNLNLHVGEICNRNFAYVAESDFYLNLKDFRTKYVYVLPVLNKRQELVEIIDLQKIKAKLPIDCLIMAGGRGKRLSPLTDSIPKPMLSIGGKPIIGRIIDHLKQFGIKKIYISLNYLGEQIQAYLGDGSSHQVSIEYLWEDEPLGTAGAVALIKEKMQKPLLVVNGDLYTNIDLAQMYVKYIESECEMIIASTDYKVDIPYAILEEKDLKISAFKEKPSYTYHSNAGIYLMANEVMKSISSNRVTDMTDVMSTLLQQNKKLMHFPVYGFCIDVGNPESYQKAQELEKHFSK